MYENHLLEGLENPLIGCDARSKLFNFICDSFFPNDMKWIPVS